MHLMNASEGNNFAGIFIGVCFVPALNTKEDILNALASGISLGAIGLILVSTGCAGLRGIGSGHLGGSWESDALSLVGEHGLKPPELALGENSGHESLVDGLQNNLGTVLQRCLDNAIGIFAKDDVRLASAQLEGAGFLNSLSLLRGDDSAQALHLRREGAAIEVYTGSNEPAIEAEERACANLGRTPVDAENGSCRDGLGLELEGNVKEIVVHPSFISFRYELGALRAAVCQVFELMELSAKLQREDESGIFLPADLTIGLAVDEALVEDGDFPVLAAFSKETNQQVIPVPLARKQEASPEFAVSEFDGSWRCALQSAQKKTRRCGGGPVGIDFAKASCYARMTILKSRLYLFLVLLLQREGMRSGKFTVSPLILLFGERFEPRDGWRVGLILPLVDLVQVTEQHGDPIADQIVPQGRQCPILWRYFADKFPYLVFVWPEFALLVWLVCALVEFRVGDGLFQNALEGLVIVSKRILKLHLLVATRIVNLESRSLEHEQ